MRLTVLGSSASYAGAGQACAGHYVEARRRAGAVRLRERRRSRTWRRVEDPLALDAVFITHDHIDHFADVYSLQAALRYAPDGPRGPMPLYLPAGLFDRMKALLSGRGAAELEEAFVPIELADGVAVSMGGLTVTPVAVEHTDPTFALVAEGDGARLVYTSDTRPCGAVYDAAAGADLLLAEATLPEQYKGAAPHMTAAQAGRARPRPQAPGRSCSRTCGRPTTASSWRRLAAEAFGAPVVVASELVTFDIAPERLRGPLR